MKTRLALLLAAWVAHSGCGVVYSPKNTPQDAIAGILDAFKTHQVVALGEGLHGNEQGHRFRLALIRDPRFPTIVNDIVVESGSSRYQDVMDRFVGGEDVPDSELERVWRNVAQTDSVFDVPIYEGFFRAVRAVSESLSKERRLRVLLGDPPIDWEQIRSAQDLAPWIAKRDSYPAGVVAREVLARHRRALLIYGDSHLRRVNEWAHGPNGLIPTLTAHIERESKTPVFSIWTNTTVQLERIQDDVKSWPVPSLTVLKGTPLGVVNFRAFAGLTSSLKMQDEYDALLYLGPVSGITMSELSTSLCADPGYMKFRIQRLALAPRGAEDIDRFRRYCSTRSGERVQ